MLVLGAACEKKTEQTQKPAVVSQKIQLDSLDTNEPLVPEKPATIEILPVEPSQSVSEIIQAGDFEKNSVYPDSIDMETEVGSLIEIELAGVQDFYSPENKIDPFRPLFREGPREEKEEEFEVSQKVEREKRIPRTPLERIDLNQLKLVGIIQAPGGNKGLVEEATGKGYIITMGTYMGTNGGRVIDILNDRVIVEEETEDVLGKLTLQKRELKLQKPFGEN